MNSFNRRQFLKTISLASVAGAFPNIVKAAIIRPHIVVIGGGFAGATAAKYLRHWSTAVDVTLIEVNANYNSCILSNLVLNNQMNLGQITFNYNILAQQYGIRVINDWVNSVDGQNQTISLRNGTTLGYDRLIIAPGVQFLNVAGLDSNRIPHAWKAGTQTTLLQQQLAAMPNNGKFVMTIPAAPYRCPPGPYERACVIADYLRTNKPGATVTILDANADIVAERQTFSQAFNVTYNGIIEYVPNAVLQSVDSDQRIAHTSLGDYRADVLNVIPPQSAGEIIHTTGLANVGGKWAGVNPLSYESTAIANIHVIGDSQGTGQPKAGHIANAEAKVCADAILRLLNNAPPFAAPVTNSACYSPITATTASWLTAVYAYDATTGTMKVVPESSGEATTHTAQNYRRMLDWANSLFADTFA
ncbi:NAD(P)/FAD-dependent oxidoreductase [Thiothrix unzii]|uniref:FAD-dependent oxidoreductase n=1 Tax=Thiothrix unzii TaxID=111769 RepID=A0A975IHG3_9GAMM|nr:FAD-dependent oxidoreductase [Thiothrix unzii]QTR54156.1 FAD-dependent oxidoreductase [Thiothrix unzii]